MKRFGTICVLVMVTQLCFASMPYNSNSRSYSSPTPRSGCSLIKRYIMQRPSEAPRPRSRMVRASPYVPPIKRIPLNRTIPACVDSVFIKGGIDLQIMGNQPCNRIALRCAYEDLTVKVCNNSIYISYNKPVSCNQNQRPQIRLSLSSLRQLVVAGDSCVRGCNLNTCCGLELENCGCGTICLEGPVQLVRVTNSGSANICIPNVRSDHIHILATRAGVVRLRGSTNLLLIRAFQEAYVDTRFLCSNTAMVQASDRALVTLKPLGSLQAFASGMSNVYYYVTPGNLYQHTMISGNVFQMGDGW